MHVVNKLAAVESVDCYSVDAAKVGLWCGVDGGVLAGCPPKLIIRQLQGVQKMFVVKKFQLVGSRKTGRPAKK